MSSVYDRWLSDPRMRMRLFVVMVVGIVLAIALSTVGLVVVSGRAENTQQRLARTNKTAVVAKDTAVTTKMSTDDVEARLARGLRRLGRLSRKADETIASLKPYGVKRLPQINSNAGPRGPTGPIGEIGPAGKVGIQGAPGVIGPQGLPGDTGERGPAGADGTPGGPAGAPGADGAPGPIGATGATGAQGEPGAPGVTTTVLVVCTGPGTPNVACP